MKRRLMWGVSVPGDEGVGWCYDAQHGGRASAEIANRNMEGGKGTIVRVVSYS